MAQPSAVVTTRAPRTVWAELLERDAGAVVSQSLTWLDCVLDSGRLEDVSRLYEFTDGHRVLMPLVRRRGVPPRLGTTGSWTATWGVGGPLSADHLTPAQVRWVLQDVAALPGWRTTIRFRHDVAAAWQGEARGLLDVVRHSVHVLDLDDGFERVWTQRFRGSARQGVRRAERSGLDVTVGHGGELLAVFDQLHELSKRRWAQQQNEPLVLRRLRARREEPHHVLESVVRRFDDDCAVWVASRASQPVASIIVLRAGGYAKYWKGAMDRDAAAPVHANDLLHRLAIEDACSRGYRYYDMGMSRPGSPLAQYKEKLGAELRSAHTLTVEPRLVRAGVEASRRVVKRAVGFREA